MLLDDEKGVDFLATRLNGDELETVQSANVSRKRDLGVAVISMGIVRVNLLHGVCRYGIHFVPEYEPYTRTCRVVRTHFRLSPPQILKYSRAQVSICVTIEACSLRRTDAAGQRAAADCKTMILRDQ